MPKCSTLRRQPLEVLLTPKGFRCILAGCNFVFLTDHKPTVYTFRNPSDNSFRVTYQLTSVMFPAPKVLLTMSYNVHTSAICPLH